MIRFRVICNGRLIEDIHDQNLEFVELLTNNTNKTVAILENQLNATNYKVMDNDFIGIYQSDISQKEISKILILNDIDIESIILKKHTLEDYFLTLLNANGETNFQKIG